MQCPDVCVVWTYQACYANANLGDLALELRLENNLNISHNGVPERFR